MIHMATPEEREQLFGFSPELFKRLEKLKLTGASIQDLISHLRQSGVPMPAAQIALRRINAASNLTEARAAVDSSAAYAKWPDYDEAYPEIYKIREATAA